MISKDFTKILHKNKEFKKFIADFTDYEIFLRIITTEDKIRLFDEYMNLFSGYTKETFINSSICSFTIIRPHHHHKNIKELKKIKIYFDNSNNCIIKVLRS